MSTTDTPWGDTGFDANDDGFMKLSPQNHKAQEPVSEPEQSSDASLGDDAASTERIRVDPVSAMPPIAPPPVARRGRSSLVWVALLALLVLVVAIIGVEWYLNSRSLEEQAFMGKTSEPEVPAEPSAPSADDASGLNDSVALDDVVPSDTTNVLVAEAQPTAVKPSISTPSRSVVPPQTATQQGEKSAKTESTVSPRQVSGGEPTVPRSKTMTTRKAQTNATEPAWVVQVFASPSRDDAEEWLQQLREQRIPDGYIVEQKVKGQSWYRVRFGQFATRADAEQAATNRGFAQPWIARVR